MTRNNSLRNLMLRRLLMPLLPILILGAGLSYFLAHRAAVSAYDLGLLDDARDIANQIKWQQGKPVLDLPPAAVQMLASNNQDHVMYAVWNAEGELIGGEAKLHDLMPLMADENYIYKDVQLTGRSYRAIIFRSTKKSQPLFISVVQTTRSRHALLSYIFFSMVGLGSALLLFSTVAVLLGVRRGLSPVSILRDEISSRSPNDLRALTEQDVPIELRPIVRGINELLEKLSASLLSHRRFIADAAHQLRTPLAALSSQLEVNLATPTDDVKAMLKQLLSTTQRASHLANQLLSLARLEHTDNFAPEGNAVDLREVVQAVAADFVAQAVCKELEFTFSVNHSTLRGSPLLLRELVANLLDNAVRYAPQKGTVSLSLQNRSSGVMLSVFNSGSGVPPDELAKLGTPFHRPPTNESDGCGLGLAIVREIARLHKATVYFDNAHHANGEISGFYVHIEFPLQ